MAASPLRFLRGVKYPDNLDITIVQSSSIMEYSIVTSICLPITIRGARYMTKVLHEYVVVSIVTRRKASIETSHILIQPLVVPLFYASSCVSYNNRIYLGAVNTTVDYKPIIKCLIFGLFYLHPTTCFDLSRSTSGDFY
jgi:hypothetical protein